MLSGYRPYQIKVLTVVRRLALNGTFTIFFFIGAPNDHEPAKYSVQPTLAGITHNFAAPIEYCDNCGRQEEQGHLVSGTLVITPILKDYILVNELRDLTPESVKPFLVKHLKWRIVTVSFSCFSIYNYGVWVEGVWILTEFSNILGWWPTNWPKGCPGTEAWD